MTNALRQLLDTYRIESNSQREKGTYFETLCKVFLENDPRFTSQFSEVWTYSEWAKTQRMFV